MSDVKLPNLRLSVSTKEVIAVLFGLFSLIMSGLVVYSHEREGSSNRISVVETKVIDTEGRLDRLEGKIDQLLTNFGIEHKR